MEPLSTALRRPWLWSVMLAAVLLISSCTMAPSPIDGSGSKSTCPARVYCLRGLWDVFSWGLTDLADGLQHEGIDAMAMSGPNWPELADYLVKSYSGVASPGPVVLVGHSYGTDNAVEVARTLNGFQIPVKLLISLDGTSPPPIPPNVERCVHLYIPTYGADVLPGGYPGHPIAVEEGNTQTDMQNIEVTVERFGPEVSGITHFDIDTNPAIHRFVIDEVLPLCTGPGPQRETIPTARMHETASP